MKVLKMQSFAGALEAAYALLGYRYVRGVEVVVKADHTEVQVETYAGEEQ